MSSDTDSCGSPERLLRQVLSEKAKRDGIEGKAVRDGALAVTETSQAASRAERGSGGGARQAGSPRLAARREISLESWMKALICMSPPHFGQTSGSNSNTCAMQRAQAGSGRAGGSDTGSGPGVASAKRLCYRPQ